MHPVRNAATSVDGIREADVAFLRERPLAFTARVLRRPLLMKRAGASLLVYRYKTAKIKKLRFGCEIFP